MYDAGSGNITAEYQLFNSTASHLPSDGGVANSVLSTVASSSTGKGLFYSSTSTVSTCQSQGLWKHSVFAPAI